MFIFICDSVKSIYTTNTVQNTTYSTTKNTTFCFQVQTVKSNLPKTTHMIQFL